MATARRTRRGLWALTILAMGCGGGALGTPPCSDGSCGTQVSTRGIFQYSVDRKVDLLLVVDDTAAMTPYLDRLATGLPQIGGALVGGAPLPLNLHVGFVRAGGCDASTRASVCGVNAPDQFLRSEWCNTMTNDSLAFADAFTCLGAFGVANCGPAQPLATAVNALANPPSAGWEGFLRPDAYLLIMILTATDDASGPAGSPAPVSDFVSRLRALKADPYQILVSVIGPGDCGAADAPGPRLTEFANGFGSNGRYVGLCSGQLAAAVDPIVASTNIEIEPPCISNVRDTDPQSPGMQADCTVVENGVAPDHSVVSQPLASCDSSQPPCWRLVQGGTCANGGRPGWIVSVDQAPDWCIEAGVNFTIECLGCADANDPACAPQTQAR